MKLISFVLFTGFISFSTSAQNQASSSSPLIAEQLHLHFDRETYRPGEIVWFKAYLTKDARTSATGITLFTELWDRNGNRIDSFISPVVNGTSAGQFILPDSTEVKELLVRSFTKSMALQNRSFSKMIWVVPENYRLITGEMTGVSLRLFPEGGTFINNLSNRVAFKATFADGSPWNFKGAIKNSSGDVVDSIWSVHDGMGSFLFTLSDDTYYFIEWEDDQNRKRKTDFPSSALQGVALQVSQNSKQILFTIQNPSPQAELSELYLVVTSQHQRVYEARINPSKKNISGIIETEPIASGIAWVSLFDKNRLLLAERPVFIHHNDLYFPTKLNIVQNNTDTTGLNLIELETVDSISTSLSIAVIDVSQKDQSGTNIFSDILLNGQPGIYNPAQYFTGSKTNANAHLDLVMLTTDWKQQSQVKTNDKVKQIIDTGAEEKFLGYSGKITDVNDKPLPGVPMAVIIQTKDESSEVFTEISGKDGSFRRDELLFADSAMIFYSITKSKAGKAKAEFHPVHDLSIPVLPFEFPSTISKRFERTVAEHAVSKQKNFIPPLFIDTFEKSGKMLEEVRVISKFDTLLLMDEKHASPGLRGLFGGRIYDFMHDPIASRSPYPIRHIFTWMVPSRVEHNCFATYLNERLIPVGAARQLFILRSSDIAYVKYAPYDPQSPCAGVYIYTKNDEDYALENEKKMNASLSHIKIPGYSPVMEFTLPGDDSTKYIEKVITDKNATVFWQPDAVTSTENKKVIISFRKTNPTSKYMVIVEGVNEKGELTYAEMEL